MNHTRTRWTLGSLACTAALAMLIARCTDQDHGGSQARGNGAGATPTGSSMPTLSTEGEAWDPADPMPMRALLIGVGAYPAGTEFSSLRGPAEDVAMVRGLLEDRFGVAPERIHEVTDSAATLEGVVRAIDEQLLQKAEAGEEALLFYSGHGSRVLDPTDTERGSRDSSLVLHDSRSDERHGSHDLTDDLIYSLLRPLAVRGVHVTVITDSCHSGGVTRDAAGSKFTVREVPAGSDTRTAVDDLPFWPAGVPFLDDDARGTRGELVRYVHIAACSPEQRAFEYPFAEDGPHGLLTWALVDVLRRAQPGDTYFDAAMRAAARIAAIPGAPPQSVWVEGPDAERELFGRRFSAVPDRFVVRMLGDMIRIEAGTVHGVQKGTVLAARDEDDRDAGKLQVTDAAFGNSFARWLDRVPTGTDGKALTAEIVAQPADLAKLQVHSGDARLRATCTESAWADVADDDGRPYVLEATGDGQVAFRTATGIPIWTAPIGETVPTDQLEAAFRRETRFSALWQLANPTNRGALGQLTVELATPMPDELRIDPNEPDSSIVYTPTLVTPLDDGEGFAVRGTTSSREYQAELPTLDESEGWDSGRPLIVLEATNQQIETVYLHVLSLNEAREVTVLFPDPGVIDRPSTMDAPTKRIPAWVGSVPEGSFPLERPMRERYLVIACSTPLELGSLENRLEPPATTKSADLPGVLAACLGGGTMRGGGSIEHPESGWGVAWLDVWISRASPR